jgi:hypothetical protein
LETTRSTRGSISLIFSINTSSAERKICSGGIIPDVSTLTKITSISKVYS